MIKKYIKRDIFTNIKRHLIKKEITMIVGPRQCGKTTIMNFLVKELQKKNKKVLFLNLDIEGDEKYFESQEKLLNKIKLEFGEKSGFVFIDEIQNKKQAGRFLKGLYDMNLPYKFIVSGSGNIEIKEKIGESLMGRKKLFQMRPITFEEFVNFKTDYKYEKRLNGFFEIENEKTNIFLLEYLNFGGYPKIITSSSIEEKNIEMSEIFNSYINKDIIKWLRVEKIDAFEKLIKIIASQIGNLVDFSKLASDTGLSIETTKNYLWYLRKTFIIKKCSPFFRNKRKEIVKAPIYYFYDLGLRNYIINQFGKIEELSNDIGFLFENLIFNDLNEKIKFTNLKVDFWRTKSQAEVDFVFDLGHNLVPIEAKFKNFQQPKIGKSLQSFIKKYKPKKAFIVNKNLSKKIIYQDAEVEFITFYQIDRILKTIL
ncbi:MAG TPA: ATP-binding protein [Candidatus Portnoybacteria bacterium]|nr:ATP-binding protein [Candidatus Portnoybacteria bacterium]